MSKYRYISVAAYLPTWSQCEIELPDDWDDMSDAQRAISIKETAFEEFKSIAMHGDDRDFYKWRRATVEDMVGWTVISDARKDETPLEEVVTQNEVWLILNGIYEYKEAIDYDDNA